MTDGLRTLQGDGDLSLRVTRVHAPMREQAVDAIRGAILDFRFKPGQRLIERELIEQTGVSRTTVREALRQLAAEGLVTTIPAKGAAVVRLTSKEARDLYEVRANLEALAGRRCALYATDDQVKDIRDACRAFIRVSERNASDIKSLLEAKDRFYDVFLDGAGNEAIRSTLAGLQARIRLLRATSLSQKGRTAGTIKELTAIVSAIEARDPDAAAAACLAHVNAAAEIALEGLADSPSTPSPSSSPR